MGKRTIVLVVALVLAAVSAFAVWQYLSNVEEDVKKDIVEAVIYRATERIDVGTEGVVARDFIAEDTAFAVDVAFEGSTIVCTGLALREDQDPVDVGISCDLNPQNLAVVLDGTVAAGPISKGQLITTEMFVSPAELNSVRLSDSIAPNMVAISIRPDEESSVGGFVRAGDKVNLLASTSLQINQLIELLKLDPDIREQILGAGLATATQPPVVGTDGEPIDPVASFAETLPASIEFTQTVLQNVEVLAVGADTRPSPLGLGLEPQGSQVVVLEVTPQQAEQIEFAKQYTSVALSLLPSDQPYTPFASRGIIVDDLFSLLDRVLEQVEGAIGR